MDLPAHAAFRANFPYVHLDDRDVREAILDELMGAPSRASKHLDRRSGGS